MPPSLSMSPEQTAAFNVACRAFTESMGRLVDLLARFATEQEPERRIAAWQESAAEAERTEAAYRSMGELAATAMATMDAADAAPFRDLYAAMDPIVTKTRAALSDASIVFGQYKGSKGNA